MTPPRVAIEVAGVTYAYGSRAVLRNATFTIDCGETVAVRGANGAGKTTLLRCLASAIRPQSGEVRWFGQRSVSSPVARRWIGWTAHEIRLYSQLTLRENLTFAARMCDVSRPAEAAEHWLGEAGLRDRAHLTPAQLSRGVQQRATIARALVHDPAILLLDEPFAGLDAEGRGWLLGLLRKLQEEGRTICFVAHETEMIQRLAQRTFDVCSGHVFETEVRIPHASTPLPARAA